MLDLADDVVTEIADDASVKRGEVVNDRRAVLLEQGLDGSQDAAIERNVRRKLALHGDDAVPGDEGRRRSPAHEGPPAPPFGVLDGLQQEGPLAPVGAGQAGEGGDGRGQIGQQLPPHRHDGVLGGQGGELVAAGPIHRVTGSSGSWPAWRAQRPRARARRLGDAGTERAVEAGVGPGVAGAGAFLFDLKEQDITVTVVVGGAHPLTVSRGVSLAPAFLPAAGPEDRPAGLERLRDRVRVHPGHHQHRPTTVLLHDGRNQAVGVVADLG